MKYISLLLILCFTLLAINFVRYPLLNISSIFSLNIPENNSKIEVSELLKKATDYCRKLESSSLFFVCKEKITMIQRKTFVPLGIMAMQLLVSVGPTHWQTLGISG